MRPPDACRWCLPVTPTADKFGFPWLPVLWLPHDSGHYLEGWYADNGSKMYVSRGIGTSTLPIRFLCRPELAIITIGP